MISNSLLNFEISENRHMVPIRNLLNVVQNPEISHFQKDFQRVRKLPLVEQVRIAVSVRHPRNFSVSYLTTAVHEW